ncbi:MAG: hypothetical protein A3C61_01160 [Candidatus Yanofskybacteria bacterium RIFCSPHIGHO2_02_FULL_39_10]|uniref:Uncharacterized protein n=1 Tax=Candidatus Yanofskybacteria bacterium RIFCSPHIGHO2_02_FULL_39_10 TaxID=1802674 RepID=A0A1F8FAF1_9BACT|nr:MAG: hypothetical protein A3C61_01160 [Candidatus Yanofskybacteria bacterium RIFCSPHIGHO2_02_FULL_39_10]
MIDSHTRKFSRQAFTVKIEDTWVGVELCSCGQMHSYWPIDKEPGRDVPRLRPEDLPEEFLKHIITRLSPISIERELAMA